MSSSNLYPSKGAIDGNLTISFPVPVRYLQITNMSGTNILKWKFKDSKDWSELEPTEIITMENINTYQVMLSGESGSYRILGQG